MIGNLMQLLNPGPPKITTIGSAAEVVRGCPKNVALNKLKLHQQLSLFILARNISADSFHFLYEKKLKFFFKNVKKFCKGEFGKYLKINDMNKDQDKQKRSLEILDSKDIKKLLLQIKYFLCKAIDLIGIGDFDGACMALIAAGTCARDYNLSKFETRFEIGGKIKVTAILANVRGYLAHLYSKAYDQETFISYLKDTCSQENISKHLKILEQEATAIEIEIQTQDFSQIIKDNKLMFFNKVSDLKQYKTSPRAYEEEILKKLRGGASHEFNCGNKSNIRK